MKPGDLVSFKNPGQLASGYPVENFEFLMGIFISTRLSTRWSRYFNFNKFLLFDGKILEIAMTATEQEQIKVLNAL